MFSKLSDLISHNQSIDSAIRSMSRTLEFEELIRSYSLLDLNINCYEIREQTAYVKCYKDRLEIYQNPAETKLSRHIATIWLPKTGKPFVTTYSENDLIDREDFIEHLRQILI